MLVQVIVLLVAVVAAVWDLKYRRIPNWLTFPAMLIGVVLGAFQGRFLWSLVGLAFGLGVMFWPWTKGWLGAGDVKLAMAFGSLLGWPLVFEGIFWGTLAGGIFGFLVLLSRGKAKRFLHGLLAGVIAKVLGIPTAVETVIPADADTLPYGVFLGLGAVMAFWLTAQGIKVLPW